MKKNELRRQYISQFYRKNRLRFAVAVLSGLLTASVNLALAWLIREIMDTVAGTPGAYSLGTLAWATAGLMGLILGFKALDYFSRPGFIRRAMEQYKSLVFQKLMDKSITSFCKEPTARYLSALSNDAASIEANYLDNLFELIQYTVLFAGSLTMMLLYSPPLMLIACGFFLIPMGVSLFAGTWMKKAERKVSEKNEAFIAALKDCLSGFTVIKSFRAEKSVTAQFAGNNHAAEQAKCEKRKLAGLIYTIGSIAGVVAQMGTFLIGGWLVLSGYSISVGTLLMFVDLTGSVVEPLRVLPSKLAARKAAIALIDKLAESLEANRREEGSVRPTCLTREIELKDVCFSYEEDAQILNDVTMKFEAGKSYAIVGASGSGKSTLLNLLMGSSGSYTGQICLDGTELREIHSDALYDIISVIQQNVFVFDTSIRENITMFGNFPKEAVDRAIELSGLSGLLKERGEDYRCGENGSGLSGGEKQRISIARSLLRSASVLLVDEATAALDAQTAFQVSSSILGLDSLTRIVVTHALDANLLSRYDEIVTLKAGRILETGTFDQLMHARGYFYSLYTVSQ